MCITVINWGISHILHKCDCLESFCLGKQSHLQTSRLLWEVLAHLDYLYHSHVPLSMNLISILMDNSRKYIYKFVVRPDQVYVLIGVARPDLTDVLFLTSFSDPSQQSERNKIKNKRKTRQKIARKCKMFRKIVYFLFPDFVWLFFLMITVHEDPRNNKSIESGIRGDAQNNNVAGFKVFNPVQQIFRTLNHCYPL